MSLHRGTVCVYRQSRKCMQFFRASPSEYGFAHTKTCHSTQGDPANAQSCQTGHKISTRRHDYSISTIDYPLCTSVSNVFLLFSVGSVCAAVVVVVSKKPLSSRLRTLVVLQTVCVSLKGNSDACRCNHNSAARDCRQRRKVVDASGIVRYLAARTLDSVSVDGYKSTFKIAF